MLFSHYLIIGVCTLAGAAWGAPHKPKTTSTTTSTVSSTTSSISSTTTTPTTTLSTSTTTSTSSTTSPTPTEIDCVNTVIAGATCGCLFEVECRTSGIFTQQNAYGVAQSGNWDECLNECDSMPACAAFSYEESTNVCNMFLSGEPVNLVSDPVGVFGSINGTGCTCGQT